jgi:hypothetical protein
MKLTLTGAVVGVALIFIGLSTMITTKSSTTETIKEIEIDNQNFAMLFTDYFQAKQGDIVVINVTATKYGALSPSLRIRQQETNTIIFGSVEGTLFQFDVPVPSDGTYRVEIDIIIGPISANGTITLKRVVSLYPPVFYLGVGAIILGILFTAIGLSTYGLALMKIRREKRMNERTRICPYCGKSVSIEKAICPQCGFDVVKSIKCGYCNGFYDRSLEKCPNCGAKQS